MKYFFILGRNPKLSREEIRSYLGSRRINYQEILFESNNLVLETNFKFNIEEFGGIISLGEVFFDGSRKDFEKYIYSNIIVDEDKFNYSIIGNVEPDELRDLFKKNKQKATLRHGRQKLKFQDGTSDSIVKTKYTFFLYESNKIVYFGQVSQNFDSKKIEFRDMNKPVRREELAISPRLSKILINLSGAKENNLMLDPFCGIGGILQEALIKKIRVDGSDIDFKAIVDCKKNLNWIKEKYSIDTKYLVEKRDVKSLPSKIFDAIATESPLGEIVTKKLDDQKAKSFIMKFENFIIPALKSMKRAKKDGAKIAITFPFIKKYKVNIQRVCEETGLKLIIFPIEEIKQKQFVGREVVVFQ